jgi:hypothetical protein
MNKFNTNYIIMRVITGVLIAIVLTYARRFIYKR